MATEESFKTVLKYISQIWFGGVGSIALAVLVVLPYPPAAFSVEPDIGSITGVRGSVVLKRPGSADPLTVKERVAFKVGDVIETDAKASAQMTLTDDSFVNLGPASSVRVSQYAFDPATDRRTAIVRVIEGKSRFVIYRLRSQESSFRVETDTARLMIGGVADFVVLASQGRTNVAVLDHGLIVRNSIPYVVGDVRIGVNQMAIVQEKSPPTAPVVITQQERKAWLKDLK